MPKTLKQVMDGLPAARRKRIEARARELISEELTLRDLRKARSQTQKAIARKLKIGQEGVSRLEQRSDLLLSTLRDYVSALGGTLEITAHFPDREPVALAGIGDSELAPIRDKAAR
jgi:transcriptional regulator with XRE-family HTH domain